jgi:hypothetical protein
VLRRKWHDLATLHFTRPPQWALGDKCARLTLIGTVSFFGKLDPKKGASFTAGIDPSDGTPSGEGVWIKVSAKDDYALCLHALLDGLRTLIPSDPTVTECVAIFEDAKKGRVVFFPNPRDPNGSSSPLSECGHGPKDTESGGEGQ